MYVHGQNLQQKETSDSKYADETSQRLLAEIRALYDIWHQANLDLHGPGPRSNDNDQAIVAERVKLFNQYKDQVDSRVYAEHFDSRSNLHSTMLEEFLYYLFKDLVMGFGSRALAGKSHAFKDIFFVPPNYRTMINTPSARLEIKDHDFIIGVRIDAKLACSEIHPTASTALKSAVGQIVGKPAATENYSFDIPAVAIECKTYLDKTMLEGCSKAAEELKARNPNALYLVVAEWLKLTDAVNVYKYEVDQVYILRKQKNTDRELRYHPDYIKNPIYPEVVWKLYEDVRHHLTSDWEAGVEIGLERGWLK